MYSASFQVLLDRRGFSPGEIDGQLKVNGGYSLAAFQQANGLTPTGEPDCETWRALTMGDDKSTAWAIGALKTWPEFSSWRVAQ